MQNSIKMETAADGIVLALATIQEQQEKLQQVLEMAISANRAQAIAQRRARQEASIIANRIVDLEKELRACPNSDLADDVVALREQQRAVQQQDARSSDRAEELGDLCQRLRLAIREGKNIAAMLASNGPIEDGRSEGGASWRVAQAQEEERQRLAREIHDGPAQALANAVFELEFCDRLLEKDPTKLKAELNRLKHDLRQSLADVRHFIFGLRLSVLSELGLTATLKRYTEDFGGRCGIEVKLELVEELQLTSTQEVAIFRIVQEALQNTRKHSRATEAAVRVLEDDGRLVVEIEDNGEGFAIEQASHGTIGHFGLRGMQERAHLIGGILEINSGCGAGTKVRLTVPREACQEQS